MAKQIKDFRPAVVNANRHTQRGLKEIRRSMQTDGYGDPMLATADGEMISGSARIETVADVFGVDAEPIIVESDGTRPIIHVRTDIPNAQDKRAQRLALAANRTHELDLSWDVEVLAGMDADVLGDLWDANELSELGEQWANEEADAQRAALQDAGAQVDKAAELQAKWQTASGQLWQLGEHRLICGDCTDKAVVERVMGGERATLAPVDPPYNVSKAYDGETVDDAKVAEEYERFSRAWFGLCQSVSDLQIVTPGCVNLSTWARLFDAYHIAPWTKSNSMTNGKVARWWCWEPVFFYGDKWKRSRSNDLFDFPVSNQKDVANHPCPKPLGMWVDLVENYSEPGDVIYEAFSGSGTTIIACEKLGRRCRAVEISAAYVAVALERFFLTTGRTPVLAA